MPRRPATVRPAQVLPDQWAGRGLLLPQLRRRVAVLLAAGRDVTFVGQVGESGTRVMARRPVARWLAASS